MRISLLSAAFSSPCCRGNFSDSSVRRVVRILQGQCIFYSANSLLQTPIVTMKHDFQYFKRNSRVFYDTTIPNRRRSSRHTISCRRRASRRLLSYRHPKQPNMTSTVMPHKTENRRQASASCNVSNAGNDNIFDVMMGQKF